MNLHTQYNTHVLRPIHPRCDMSATIVMFAYQRCDPVQCGISRRIIRWSRLELNSRHHCRNFHRSFIRSSRTPFLLRNGLDQALKGFLSSQWALIAQHGMYNNAPDRKDGDICIKSLLRGIHAHTRRPWLARSSLILCKSQQAREGTIPEC